MVSSIHHLDNQLLGKALPIKESQDKPQKSILSLQYSNQIKEAQLRLPTIWPVYFVGRFHARGDMASQRFLFDVQMHSP